MNFGLTINDLEFLKKNLIIPLKNQGARVFIFGSRAINKEKPFSDIDILYQETSNNISPSFITNLLNFFEDSNFSYKIDLVNEKNLAESYRENINKQLIEV